MTLLAPEPRPATPLASPEEPGGVAAPGGDPGADLDVVTAALVTWWDRLPLGRRAQLLSLTPDEVLPRSVASELQRLGVDCPLTLVAEGGRQVRRARAPQALLDLVERERAR